MGEGFFELAECFVAVLEMRCAIDHEHAGHHDGCVLESLRERKHFKIARIVAEFANLCARGCNHDFGTVVETCAGVIKRVDGRRRLEM